MYRGRAQRVVRCAKTLGLVLYMGFRANTLEPCDRATARQRPYDLHGSTAIFSRIL